MKAGPALALAVLIGACGGSSSSSQTMAGWRAGHGQVVTEVGAALDRVQASTQAGEPTAIRANCEGLRDSVDDARSALPVPDAAADAAVRRALDALAAGAGDCVRATTTGDVRLLERSITELKAARLELDTANAKLAAS